jgi:hypothetical protein
VVATLGEHLDPGVEEPLHGALSASAQLASLRR